MITIRLGTDTLIANILVSSVVDVYLTLCNYSLKTVAYYKITMHLLLLFCVLVGSEVRVRNAQKYYIIGL